MTNTSGFVPGRVLAGDVNNRMLIKKPTPAMLEKNIHQMLSIIVFVVSERKRFEVEKCLVTEKRENIGVLCFKRY